MASFFLDMDHPSVTSNSLHVASDGSLRLRWDGIDFGNRRPTRALIQGKVNIPTAAGAANFILQSDVTYLKPPLVVYFVRNQTNFTRQGSTNIYQADVPLSNPSIRFTGTGVVTYVRAIIYEPSNGASISATNSSIVLGIGDTTNWVLGEHITTNRLNSGYAQFGTLNDRPTDPYIGSEYVATDNGHTYLYDGLQWVRLS